MGNSDSRTLFRDHIQQLVNEDLPDDSDFWQSLFTLDASLDDIMAMVSVADITRLQSEYRANFFKLLDMCIQTIEESHNQVMLLDTEQLLCTSNSIRFLIRILPISLHSEDNEETWWDSPRLYRLLRSSIGLLHTPVYSVFASISIVNKSNSIVLALMWKEGLLTKVPVVEASEAMWQRRYELLLLLKACVSDMNDANCLNKGAFLVTAEAWIDQVVYSVLNTLITFNPAGTWNLPYSSYAKSLHKEKALKVGLQVIGMLDFLEDNDRDKEYCGNRVKHIFKGIKERSDLDMIWKAVRDMMKSIYISQNTYLPASQKVFKMEDELVLTLFVLVKENEGFLQFVAAQDNCLEIIMPILDILLKQPSRFIGMLCAYILVKFSEIRRFCVLLNASLDSCTLDLPLFTGSYADLLIISIKKIIIHQDRNLEPIYHLLLIILSNITYYTKSLCIISCHNIIELMQYFAVETFSGKKGEELIGIMLECINNCVQYQWRGTGYIVYWIIKYSSFFYKIQKNCGEVIQNLVKVPIIIIENMNNLSNSTEAQFIEALRSTTLVGLFPIPHPILTRKINFQDSRLLNFGFEYFFASIV